ncbi:MAG: hemolysin III family protein [Pirellulaceae bacterium]|nr:hemolysin III family protein [Planctomycetales bacterium]
MNSAIKTPEVQYEAVAAKLPASEIVHAVTHGVGFVLSIVGGITLVVRAGTTRDAWCIAGCLIFVATLVAVYAASTLSHCLVDTRRRRMFELIDQAVIYLLIAGTYTPFGLTYLRFGWWWLLLAAMWSLAALGFIAKLAFYDRIGGAAVWTYVLLGWLPVMAVRPIFELVPEAGLYWMFAGGLCYTIGTVFLVCDIQRFHFHAIWHLFVMAGSACHFVAILFFVAMA